MYTPSVSVAPREASEEKELGNYKIPTGTKAIHALPCVTLYESFHPILHVPVFCEVMCNIYGAHRHPSLWNDHDKFDPMRFNEAPNGEDVKVTPTLILYHYPDCVCCFSLLNMPIQGEGYDRGGLLPVWIWGAWLYREKPCARSGLDDARHDFLAVRGSG